MNSFCRRIVSSALCSGLFATVACAQEVNVSIVTAFAGPYANYGQALTNAAKLALEDLNSQNYFGPMKVILTVQDNRSDKQEAISLVTRVANSTNAVAIIGPASSAEAFAAGPVANQLKIPMITQGAASDILKIGPWVFKSPESAPEYMGPLAKYVIESIKPKSCFFVTIRDSEAYIIQKDVLMALLGKGGIATVGNDAVLQADTDFTALSTKIVASKPDCLYVSAPVEIAANIIVQAKQAGLPSSTTILGDPNNTSSAYLKIGGGAVEGTIASAWFDPDGVNDMAKNFIAKYKERYGLPADTFAAQGYSVMMVLAHAIRNAAPNPTREAVKNELTKTRDVPAVLGNGLYSFTEDRSPSYNSVVLKLKDGKWGAAR